MKITRGQLAEAARKHWGGLPMQKCAADLGISQVTLAGYFREHGLDYRDLRRSHVDRTLKARERDLALSARLCL